MTTGKQLAGLLLLTTALTHPGTAFAQEAAAQEAQDVLEQAESVEPEGEPPVDNTDISIPGGAIIVTGRVNRDPARSSSQVLSVLSSEQIARTGEGNIAGALGRVTGLSVVGSGYVYVRGLGDRYSLALLNGSPLPSPQPLSRTVPLDIFPTGLVASSLVQKSYSANFPGEFGGGVINLTTRAIPKESFLTVSLGGAWDSETTNQTGYTYYGSATDWTGFENGQRDLHPALDAYFKSGALIGRDPVDTQAIARELVTSRNAVVQRYAHMYPNFSGSFSSGVAFDVGDSRVGVILGGGYSNKHVTRDAINQTPATFDLSGGAERDFRRVTTDQRIVVNALLGLGFEIGDHTIRWTNLFIRDTIKHTRLGLGRDNASSELADIMEQETAWYERQLIDTQIVAELVPADGLELDVRYGYANSQREAPGELKFTYVRSNVGPLGDHFINTLTGNPTGASITFSDLNEDLFSGGIDLSYTVTPTIVGTIGAAFANTERRSSRRGFLFRAPSTFPTEVGLFRPDLLLQPSVIEAFNITLVEDDPSNPAFRARLDNYAGYGKLAVGFTDTLSLDAGVRYETADQTVESAHAFDPPTVSNATTALSNSYWLPGATLTWAATPDLQFRVSGSKTIARPQFRELIYQQYFDPDTNRIYFGNPLLVDSELTNFEGRVEYYLGRDQRVSLSGFYKRIERPIEAFIFQLGSTQVTTFANAPKATLYGAEFELQKYFDLEGVGFLPEGTRAVLIGNYTYTKSQLQVQDGDQVRVFASSSGDAVNYFRDGAPLTGQADHLANLQLGLENQDRLSQQTFLVSYSSKRVVSRGLNGTIPEPDVYEDPGVTLDFVAREGITLFGREVELKAEVRNILGTKHKEYQALGENRIEVNTYKVGTTFSGSISVTF